MNKSASNGIGLPGVLFLIFLILKLTGNIDWSWWWVTSPIWIPFLLVIGILFIVLFVFIALLMSGWSVEDIKAKYGKKDKTRL